VNHHLLQCAINISYVNWEYFLDLKFIMELHEKVKFFRKVKKLSQESIAFEIGLNQSQYSRRESGVIKFNSQEILVLSNILEVNPSELFSDQTVLLNNKNQQGGNFAQYISLPAELMEQYEKRLQEKDELIQLLKDKISLLEK